jgi:hypothetical protein
MQKFLDWVDNEIYAYNNKHSRSNTQRDTAAKLTRLTHKIAIQLHLVAQLYHLRFSLEAASPEISGYTVVYLQRKWSKLCVIMASTELLQLSFWWLNLVF